MEQVTDNPMGTDGFEFIEYASPQPEKLEALFKMLGFQPVAKHVKKDIVRYVQGDITFLLNKEPDNFAQQFAALHGPCVCAMAFRVKDASYAYNRALKLGAEPFTDVKHNLGINLSAIKGIGGSLIYFVDQYGKSSVYEDDFVPLVDGETNTTGVGLFEIDHLTHNVYQGEMNKWAEYYERLFNFREIRYFDIKGQQTGLLSRAMTSPCGKIRIPINEPTDNKSQIAEYLDEYQGEGIQHIALSTDNIYETIESLRKANIDFLTVPDTYYGMIDERIPGHGEDLPRLQKNKILIDGQFSSEGLETLLQIFTKTVIGPIFYEIIQRKGNEGFGEGNFQALFDAIERDQIERGVLTEAQDKAS